MPIDIYLYTLMIFRFIVKKKYALVGCHPANVLQGDTLQDPTRDLIEETI